MSGDTEHGGRSWQTFTFLLNVLVETGESQTRPETRNIPVFFDISRFGIKPLNEIKLNGSLC